MPGDLENAGKYLSYLSINILKYLTRMTQIKADNAVAIWMLRGWKKIHTDCLAPLHTGVSLPTVALRTGLSEANKSYMQE